MNNNNQTIGFVGGGQLARMIGQEIKKYNLPYDLIVLDPTDKCPANEYSKEQIIGRFDDPIAIEELANKSDILTFEIELADYETLKRLEDQGKEIHPSPETLGIIKDKYTQSKLLEENGLPVPKSKIISNLKTLEKTLESSSLPVMIKKRVGSYDGRGNYLLKNIKQISEVEKNLGSHGLMQQEYIDFSTEVSVIAARNTKGKIATYEVVENIHTDNILRTTLFPALNIPESIRKEAEQLAYESLDILSGAGVFGIEMFLDKKNNLYINEISPRVHNSGHHTIESCETSQFIQHILAITGQNLGSTKKKVNYAVMENIIETGPMNSFYTEGTKENDYSKNIGIHLYGKHSLGSTPRKMGHLTVTSSNENGSQEQLMQYAKDIRKNIVFTKNE